MISNDFKLLGPEFKKQFQTRLKTASIDRQQHFDGIVKIYFNKKINSYYIIYDGTNCKDIINYEITDEEEKEEEKITRNKKIDEYKYVPLEIKGNNNIIDWMIENGGWNIYTPYPSYVQSYINKINFDSVKKQNDIEHISIINRYNNTEQNSIWCWVNSKTPPDKEATLKLFYGLLDEKISSDSETIMEYLKAMINQLIEHIKNKEKSNNENEEKSNNEINFKIPERIYCSMEHIVNENSVFVGGYIKEKLEKIQSLKLLCFDINILINITKQYFPKITNM